VIGRYAAAAGSLVLLAVAVSFGWGVEPALLVWLLARLAKAAEAVRSAEARDA